MTAASDISSSGSELVSRDSSERGVEGPIQAQEQEFILPTDKRFTSFQRKVYMLHVKGGKGNQHLLSLSEADKQQCIRDVKTLIYIFT